MKISGENIKRRIIDTAIKWMVILLIATSNVTYAKQNEKTQEKLQKIKAVFLLKLFNYIEWPADVIKDLTICTYGEVSFTKYLHLIVKEKSAYKAFIIQSPTKKNQFESCHILFVDKSKRTEINEIFNIANNHKNVVTISDLAGFAKQGGFIELYTTTNGRVGLRINLALFNDRKYRISSKLMKIVEVVE